MWSYADICPKFIFVMIVVLLVLCLACPLYAQGDTQGGLLSGLTLDVVYAHSITNDSSGTLLLARLPFYEIDVGNLGVTLTFTADLATFLDGMDIGPAIGAKVEGLLSDIDILSGLSVGLAYLPRGYGVSYYIGIKRLI